MRRKPTKSGIGKRAKEIGVTEKTAHAWRNAGVDINDDAAVRAHVATLRRVPVNINPQFAPAPPPVEIPSDTPPEIEDLILRLRCASDYNTARLLKTQVDGLRSAIDLREAMRTMVPIHKVRENFLRVGAAVKASIMRMEADLPPMLAGMTEVQAQAVIRRKVDEILTALSDGESEFWKEHEAT